MRGAISVWTAYVIVSRRVKTPPITATAVQAGLSVVVMLPLLAIVGMPMLPLLAWLRTIGLAAS